MAIRCTIPRAIGLNRDLPSLRDNGATLDEIGAVLSVSKEGVRQTEVVALVKCRRWADRHGYRVEDLVRFL